MPIIFFIGILLSFNWLLWNVVVAIPINLGHWLGFIAFYILLGLSIVLFSWFLGDS